jgi:anaerobic magnesium-protoporphyrin IX monomethyl ester cyclase
MLSILVAHSYFLRFDAKQRERAKPYPPLATLQVAGMLRQAGHSVRLFDAMLADGLRDYRRLLRADQPQLVLLYEDNFNFLSKMCLGKMRSAACEMVAAAHRAGVRVIAAGADASDAPEPYLRAGADLVLLGEGLAALAQLLVRLDARPDAPRDELVQGVTGVASLVGGGPAGRGLNVARGAGGPSLPARDELPAWDLVDIDRYRSAWLNAHGYFSLNMAASRGCPFRCTWCAKPIWGNRYLQREPRAVAAEMAHLKRAFGVDHVWFADDIFGLRPDWISEFARALHAERGAIPFTIQTRADLISERMAAALREAGCREAWIGAESGSQRVLDAMHKGTDVAEILRARERLKAAGIRVGFFIQLGYLGEELGDIQATRELIETARPDDVGVSVAYPLPGTRFHDLVSAQLGAKNRWQASGELAMMFPGTYTTDFYRQVRDLLHEQVRMASRQDAARPLQRRWDRLLARHESFFNTTLPTPAAAASPAAGFS